jgi:hypothetical protein
VELDPCEVWPDVERVADWGLWPRVHAGSWVRIDRRALVARLWPKPDGLAVREGEGVAVRELRVGGALWLVPYDGAPARRLGPAVEVLGRVRSVLLPADELVGDA